MAGKAKRTYVRFITAPGTAAYCYLRAPDSGRQFSDDKYKLTLMVPKAEEQLLDPIRKACADAAKAEWGSKLPSGMSNPIKDGAEKAAKDPEKWGDLKDYFMVTFKAQRAPGLFDGAGKPLSESVNIFGGDVVRVNGAAAAFVSGQNKGVTLYLNDVQLIQKNHNENPFDAVEGAYGYEEDGEEEAGDASNPFNI